jgi:hypothetical protein
MSPQGEGSAAVSYDSTPAFLYGRLPATITGG